MNRKTPLAAALATLFSTAIAAPAFAQDAQTQQSAPQARQPDTAEPADDTTLPTVNVSGAAERGDFQAERSTIGAKTPTAIHDIAQAVTVVNKAVLESQGATSFQDALRNVPGVTIGGAEGGQIGNNINLRGFTARTDIYRDGFRDRGQYYRDTFDLESIEVLYGPSSMLFGRGSTGGVINQTSKQAGLKPVTEISGQVGTRDRYRTTVDIDRAISDTAAVRVNAFGQDVSTSRDQMKNKDWGFAPQIRFGIGSPTEVTLSALIQHNRDMPDYGILPVNGHPAPVGRDTYYGLTDDRTIQDVQVATARIEHRFNDQYSLRNQTRFAHYMTDARETSSGRVLDTNSVALTNGNFIATPPSALRVALASHDRVINDHALYNTTDFLAKLDTGPVHHDIVAGVELGRDSYTNQSYSRSNLPVVPLIDPPYLTSPANVVTTAGNLAESSAETIAGYFNDTASIGQHWKVVAGLRWDRYQSQISNTTSAPRYTHRTDYFTSVRTGLIYQPDDVQSYYFSYGTSFDPSLETLTVTNLTQDLTPEKNRSYELGSKWDLIGGNLSVNSSLFRIEKTNARTQVSTTEYTLDGKVRVDGFQTGVTGRITRDWQVFGGYTYMDATILEARDGTQGKTPANTPRHMVTLWSTYALTPMWEVGGGMVYMSSRYAANNNLVSAGGFTRWDATVAFHQPRYDLRLNLLNLTNKYYYESLIPSDGGRAVPGSGRTLLATATFRF
jgi:catecholate siderophore receptor